MQVVSILHNTEIYYFYPVFSLVISTVAEFKDLWLLVTTPAKHPPNTRHTPSIHPQMVPHEQKCLPATGPLEIRERILLDTCRPDLSTLRYTTMSTIFLLLYKTTWSKTDTGINTRHQAGSCLSPTEGHMHE